MDHGLRFRLLKRLNGRVEWKRKKEKERKKKMSGESGWGSCKSSECTQGQ